MANLQQCLLQKSVHPPRQRRRRRKRNKGKKDITTLNNSIIHQYSLQRYGAGSNTNNNYFRFDTSIRSAVNRSCEKLRVSQAFEKSAVNQTIDLCSDDSTNETINSSFGGDYKSCVISQEKENVIDLSTDVSDEVEIIILPNDKNKPPETKNPCITPHQNKPPDTQPLCSKSLGTPSNNGSPRTLLHTRLEGKSHTQSPNLKSFNDKPAVNKPPECKLHHCGPENKHPFSKLSDTQPPSSELLNAKSDTNGPPEIVVLGNRPENKSSLSKPDTQPPNSKSPNDKCVINKLPECKLHHRRTEIKSSPSKPLDTQPLNSKSPNDKPVNNEPPEILVLDSRTENKFSLSKPDTQLPNPKSPNSKPPTNKPRECKLHSKPDDKTPNPKSPNDKLATNRTPECKLHSRPHTQPPNPKSPNDKPAANKPTECKLHSRPDTQPPNSELPNDKPATNKPRECKLHSRPHTQPPNPMSPNDIPATNKPTECKLHSRPDTQPPNSKSPNDKPAIDRPPKIALLHSRPEDKSPLSEPPEKKSRCIIHHEYEEPKGKPGNSSPLVNKPETLVIDISEDGSECDPSSSQKSDTNDEVLVIGTFSKTSRKPKVPSKNHPKKTHKKLTAERPRKHREHSREQRKEPLRSCSKERPKENPTEQTRTKDQGFRAVRRQGALDLAEPSGGNSNANIVKLRRRIKAKYFRKMLHYKKKMEVDLFDTIKYQHLLINNTLSGTELAGGVGKNVYVSSPVYIPTSGLRPIMIDGSNVAFTSQNQYKFSCKRLDICIKYFKEKGHKVTAFVPQFRVQSHQSDNPGLLDQLVRSGDVVLTPSKVIDGKLIVPYDDRFIVQAAVLKGGIIISRDNYKDLLEENPTWAETIKYRTLAYTWVDDVLMFPSDPLGVIGPSLEEFLRFN